MGQCAGMSPESAGVKFAARKRADTDPFSRALMKRSLPWLSSLLAGVLLFTPTYGIGLAISPLTLIGSTIALSPLARATRAVRIGAAVNLLVLVSDLSLLTAI
jgi:hypothetical protein